VQQFPSGADAGKQFRLRGSAWFFRRIRISSVPVCPCWKTVNKFLLTLSFVTIILRPSLFLTILGLFPRFLGELDSVNAMISGETKSLQKESNYEYSTSLFVSYARGVGQSRLDAGWPCNGTDPYKPA
jgi:hypothetical protein